MVYNNKWKGYTNSKRVKKTNAESTSRKPGHLCTGGELDFRPLSIRSIFLRGNRHALDPFFYAALFSTSFPQTMYLFEKCSIHPAKNVRLNFPLPDSEGKGVNNITHLSCSHYMGRNAKRERGWVACSEISKQRNISQRKHQNEGLNLACQKRGKHNQRTFRPPSNLPAYPMAGQSASTYLQKTAPSIPTPPNQ